MVAGFELISNIGDKDVMEHKQGKASTQYAKNAAMELTATGLFQHVDSQTDVVTHIFSGMVPYFSKQLQSSDMRPATEDLTTTRGEKVKGLPVGDLIFATDITPLADDVAALTNTTTTQCVFAALGYGGEATNDFTNGTVYFPVFDSQHHITGDTFGGGNHTLDFVPATVRAVTVGDTIRACVFGPGRSPKLNSSNPHLGLSNAAADKAGGKVLINSVDLKNKRAYLSFLRS